MDITLGYIILLAILAFSTWGVWTTTRALKKHEDEQNNKRKLSIYRSAEKMALYRLEQSEVTRVIYSK